MTKTSHQILNVSAGIAVSFHWPIWLILFLAASIPDLLDPPNNRQFSRRLYSQAPRPASLPWVIGAALPVAHPTPWQAALYPKPHRGLFHTYSIWLLLGAILFFVPLPTTQTPLIPGLFVSPLHLRAIGSLFLAGILLHLFADTGSRQGCSVLLPCSCHKLGHCRCPWYTRRLALKWYKTGDASETLFLVFFCLACAGLAFWRSSLGWDAFALLP